MAAVLGMPGTVAAVVGGFLVQFFLFIYIYATRYTKVGPNEVLVVSGQKRRLPSGEWIAHRFVKGGGTFVWPVFEQAWTLSLEIIATEFSVTAGGRSASGTLQLKIPGDDKSLRIAAENFLSRSHEEIVAIGREVVEICLRGILEQGGAPDRGALEGKIRGDAAPELARIGLEVVSFSVMELRDA